MYKIAFSLAVGLASLSVTPTSAAPIGNLSGLSNDVVQVQHRMICDQRGRCYRAAPRNARRNVMRDDRSPGVGIGIGGFGVGVGPGW